jgi:hypothetical protein
MVHFSHQLHDDTPSWVAPSGDNPPGSARHSPAGPGAPAHAIALFPGFPAGSLRPGRFCYVYYAGAPLCRLGYRGQLQEWDFAIYKYSTQRYGELELTPSRDTVFNCVDLALHAYDFR